MLFQFINRIELPFQFLLRKHFMNLGVTGTANPDYLPNDCAIEIALISFVVMPRARNQVMACHRLFTATDGTVIRNLSQNSHTQYELGDRSNGPIACSQTVVGSGSF